MYILFYFWGGSKIPLLSSEEYEAHLSIFTSVVIITICYVTVATTGERATFTKLHQPTKEYRSVAIKNKLNTQTSWNGHHWIRGKMIDKSSGGLKNKKLGVFGNMKTGNNKMNG